ncbi:alpha/beta hydrolase [Catellatospora tritici]|uniref:alpha/beta hydrolase n=1 Tax=Catellatospora tritici TaxID=2851566 RepID=UPI001C2CD725|nr:alpha/beta hydrolase fold domain-containing protein [Catellatospora tritici]MBV1854124.1 alpha/beta fold hydrolase [Catellatospora tritici]
MSEDRSVLTRTATAPDETLRYGQEPEHVADAWHGDARALDRPLVLIVHGGFWRPEYDRAHTHPMAAAIRDAGWTVCSTEYRRQPGVPDVTTRDVADAIATLPNALTRHDGRVIVVGHSAGGHLALWAAAAAPAAGLAGTLALAPVADLVLAEELHLDDGAAGDFLGVPAAERADLDPARLSTPSGEVVLLHGVLDEVVPIALARSYAVAHPGSRLVAVPDTGHFAVIDPLSAAWPTVLEQLSRLGD